MIRLMQAIMKSLYSTVVHTSMIISNVIGPMEKVAIDGNPLKSCSFFVTGAPIVSKQTAQTPLTIFYLF